MKTRNFLSSMAIMAILILPGACSEEVEETVKSTVNAEEAADIKEATVPDSCKLTGTIADVPVPVCVISGASSDSEAEGLLFMREEEKMARDVYAYLYDKYQLPVFKNITKSENAHMSAVLRLIEGFGITDNGNNNSGEYANTHIAELYDQLIEMGNISEIEALKVGVLIEQTDIADLQKELLTVENSSIKTVYGNLLKGSGAHLKAFTWNLEVRGVAFP
jgi:hypothetical protein